VPTIPVKTSQQFSPDWISAPSETIADLIEEQQWDQVDLADRLGYSSEQLTQLLSGQMPIAQETALRLENTLGSSSSFWLNREAQYRAKLAQQSTEISHQSVECFEQAMNYTLNKNQQLYKRLSSPSD
jgi:HTH-type transcriptional regulator / antitoxin HigA